MKHVKYVNSNSVHQTFTYTHLLKHSYNKTQSKPFSLNNLLKHSQKHSNKKTVWHKYDSMQMLCSRRFAYHTVFNFNNYYSAICRPNTSKFSCIFSSFLILVINFTARKLNQSYFIH